MKFLRRTLAVAVLVWFGTGLGSASAHADLDSSDPAPSSVLADGPSEIFLDFSEPVTTSSDSVELFDQDGAPVAIDAAEVSSSDATVVVAGGLPELNDGLYVVAWRVVSDDGHVAEGAYTFEVGSGGATVDAGGLVSSVLAQREAQSGLALGIAVSRFLAYLALALVVGGLSLMAAEQRVARRIWSVTTWSLGTLALATLAHFVLQGPYSHGGSWVDAFDSSLWSSVLDTRLGIASIVRLGIVAGLVVVSMGVHPAVDRSRRLASAWWRSLVALLGAATVMTFATAGHPSASHLAGVSVAVDAVHLTVVSLWIGGLLVTIIGGPDEPDRLARFSRIATWCAPIALASGIWQVHHLAGGLAALGESAWGRSVLVKVALAIGAVTLGAVARTLIVRATGDEPTRHALRRIMAVEVVIALAVFGTTAYLVAEPPRATIRAAVFETTIAQGSLIAAVTVTPGVIGSNEIHVLITPAGGTLERMSSVTMRMVQPDPSLPPLTIPVAEVGPNHYVGSVALLSEGNWTLEILAQPDPSTSVRLTTEVPVAG